MRRILHLSDLHFGRVDAATLAPIAAFARERACDLLVVSGDLTQRARREEFLAAREFLQGLPIRNIVVPGNHDIPLYKLWLRFTRPFRNFMNFISRDLEPIFVDDEVAVVGLNTVSLWSKDGTFGRRRFARLAEKFRLLPPATLKILVSHHAVPALHERAPELKFDCLLAGHDHRPSFALGTPGETAPYLIIQAGTATSDRLRHGHTNSFNLLESEGAALTVAAYEWSTETHAFAVTTQGKFTRTPGGWRRA